MSDEKEKEKKEEGGVKKPRDLRQEVTDKLVEALDKGEIPWNKPWESLELGMPRNMVSGREYTGANSLILMLEQRDRGHKDPRYGTFKQINELGGKVTRGEKGIPVEFWGKEPFYQRRDTSIKYLDRAYKVFSEDRDVVHIGGFKDSTSTLAICPRELKVHHQDKVLTWDEAHKTLDRITARTYVVFNVEQCTDLEKLPPLILPDYKIPTNERAERIMAAMQKDSLGFAEHPEHAFYSPKRDEVSLPPRQSFKTVEGYYGTALHEIGHATGAAQRLNREGITGGHRFGSEGYAKEELRAEIFSAFMAVQTGIPHDMTQHQAYVKNWSEVLKKDKHEIFRAAAEAGKAVDYVLAKERDLQIDHTRESTVTMENAQVDQVSSEKQKVADPSQRTGPTNNTVTFKVEQERQHPVLDVPKENMPDLPRIPVRHNRNLER
ncbi:ArdC family protein [Ferrovum myxofaciens]|jgi:antirestriction protein ArdC|uniref:ArdC family protein n=1 Tax=Ferrovum myxofaciens TaxID=416213 RepID=UPI000692158E|nr:zincin-like metallopeptidase domain-containing protein [Ferrovum myxofaciens]